VAGVAELIFCRHVAQHIFCCHCIFHFGWVSQLNSWSVACLGSPCRGFEHGSANFIYSGLGFCFTLYELPLKNTLVL
jgi:hypothetical protein